MQKSEEPRVGEGKNLTLIFVFLMKLFQGTQIALVDEGMFFTEFHKCIQMEQLDRCHVATLDAMLDSDDGHQWLKQSGQRDARA